MDAYTKDSLPVQPKEMRLYRKVRLTRMWFVQGPFKCETQYGSVTLPDDWRGYLAIDTEGHPYPIAETEHAMAYEEVLE